MTVTAPGSPVTAETSGTANEPAPGQRQSAARICAAALKTTQNLPICTSRDDAPTRQKDACIRRSARLGRARRKAGDIAPCPKGSCPRCARFPAASPASAAAMKTSVSLVNVTTGPNSRPTPALAAMRTMALCHFLCHRSAVLTPQVRGHPRRNWCFPAPAEVVLARSGTNCPWHGGLARIR